ncbi:MAG TPA: hypothetical protein VMC03_07405 [Streptosporangiaceae bacterium]|nr:hypothetical protein [Streptosporangiaceae bacterium]
METVMDMLALTDDEAVALATFFPDPWRAPLPTVDLTNRDDLARAAYRGRRSLVVRDLAEPDGSPAGLAAEVVKRLATGLRAFFVFTDENGDWLPGGVTVYLYGPALDAIEVSQTVADAGVHYFRLAPPPGQWQALASLAESIYADGFADPAGQPGKARPAAALLHVVRPDGIRSIRVARGTATTGRGPVPAPFPSISAAIAWLLA